MYFGVTFPQTEIGADAVAIRDYAQAAAALGYSHIVAGEHVLSPGYTHPKEVAPYRASFHEPFALFGYLAALTPLELLPSVIILPQRQTVLVAKQAAEIDVLTGGKLRLGVGLGWNSVEFEALGVDFRQRGRIFEEQVEILRRLWKEEYVTYHGTFHTISDAGLNPRPIQRPIPLWMGGHADAALRRIARLADGWLPLGQPEAMRPLVERLRLYAREAGRDPAEIGLEGMVNSREGQPDEWVRQTEAWRELGATHITFSTAGRGFSSVSEHIEAIRSYKDSVSSDE
ncbi:MAG TPA: LLM class F420-dependent oxidoreductase [Ktedonobacteraceae bacterium]|nr:LLM class F420-dependent oxidoreductase [Ktedonobacteraceae bacterium]